MNLHSRALSTASIAVETGSIAATQPRELVTKIAPAFVAHRDRAQSLLNEIK